MPLRYLCLTFLRLRAAVIRTLQAVIIILLRWTSLVRVLPVIASGPLHLLAVPLLSAFVGIRAGVFRSRSHVLVQLQSAVGHGSLGSGGLAVGISHSFR